MTLAETASIFSEILLYSRAVEDDAIKIKINTGNVSSGNIAGNCRYSFKILF